MSLPREWKDRARALPGRLLIQRTSQGHGGLIIIPGSVRRHQKSPEATIVHVGAGLPSDFIKGATVLLAGGVGRKIVFGDEFEDDDCLFTCSPDEILHFIDGEVEAQEDTPSTSPRESIRANVASEGRAEESP